MMVLFNLLVANKYSWIAVKLVISNSFDLFVDCYVEAQPVKTFNRIIISSLRDSMPTLRSMPF